MSNDERISKKFRIEIDFELFEKLIYYTENEIRRLCLFINVEEKIFRLTHDENMHVDIHRYFNRIANIFYISRLSKKIRRYIEHCFNCQFTQTKRHRSYEKLMLITSSSQLFHTIIIDFILTLFDELNVIFIVTNKFSRRVTLIFDKFIYNVNQ